MDKINFTDRQIKEIISLHNKGLLNREISEIFNVSKSTIGRVLQNNNVESRHPKLNKEREQKVCQLYLSGKNKNQIEKDLKINTKTINFVLDKYEIKSRTNTEIHKKYTLDEQYFENINTPRKAYFLGLLYADGTVNNKRFSIALQEQDKHILESFLLELHSDRPLYFRNYKCKNENWSNQYVLSISNVAMCQDLMNLGVVPHKSLILDFPNENILNPKFYSSFLLGYMDGDGCIIKNEARCTLVSTEQFCNKVKIILENKLNIHCSISYCHQNVDTSTRDLRISGKNQVMKFLDWIYSDSKYYLFRKYNIYQELYCN